MFKKINVANPTDRDWTRHSFLFAFGQVSALYVLTYANSCEDALEVAAEWLAEHAPGHLMEHRGEEHKELVKEACEDHGVSFPDLEDGYEGYEEIFEDAEADLTYTEAGWLTSYEWTIVGEDMTREELIEFYNCVTHRGEI